MLYGRSDEDALTPYQPFVEIVGHCFSHGPVEELARELRPDELEELGRLVPAVRRWLPAASAPSGPPDVERYRLFEAIVALVTRLADRGMPVVICDDLQWADPPTLQLLAISRVPRRRGGCCSSARIATSRSRGSRRWAI